MRSQSREYPGGKSRTVDVCGAMWFARSLTKLTNQHIIIHKSRTSQASTMTTPSSMAFARRPVSLHSHRMNLVGRQSLTEREIFYIFIKILLKQLESTGDPRLNLAKAIIKDCTIHHRRGDIGFSPLQQAIELHLRRAIGELPIALARQHLRGYMDRRGLHVLPDFSFLLNSL
jgi:hypothetical protein